MNIDEKIANFILNDGEIISCSIIFKDGPSASIGLKVREKQKGKQTDVILELIFKNLVEINLFEDFETAYYSDITLIQLSTGEYYLSLDPFSNTNEPNEKDNFVIQSKNLEISRISILENQK